jgi:hypothetical protein
LFNYKKHSEENRRRAGNQNDNFGAKTKIKQKYPKH